MALYLGGNKIKINLDGNIYCLNLMTTTLAKSNIGLLSSDNFILKDSNGLCLISYDTEMPDLSGNIILTLDNYILTDINGLYLTTKESE